MALFYIFAGVIFVFTLNHIYMKNYRIIFTHHGNEYSFTKAISANLSQYNFEVAYRTEIRTYMTNHGLNGNYEVVGVIEI